MKRYNLKWTDTSPIVEAEFGLWVKFIDVADLETLCDPAGIVAENALLKDQTRQLDAMISRRKKQIAVLEASLRECVSQLRWCNETYGRAASTNVVLAAATKLIH